MPQARGFSLDGFAGVVVVTDVGGVVVVEPGSSPELDAAVEPSSADPPRAGPAVGTPRPALALPPQSASPAGSALPAIGVLATETASSASCSYPLAVSDRRSSASTGGQLPAESGRGVGGGRKSMSFNKGKLAINSVPDFFFFFIIP